jgi:hypothetical protein
MPKKKQPVKPEKPVREKKLRQEKPKKPEKQPKEKPEIQKPEKDKLYKSRKKAPMLFLRVLLWGMLGFIFLRGVITSLRPDTAGEALRVISDFRAEFSGYKELDSELLGFAEGFAFDYLKFTAGEEADYRERLLRYAARTFTDTMYIRFTAGTEAQPLYVRAYRKEIYSPTQFDVYVIAEVLYTWSENIEVERTDENRAGIETHYYSEPERITLRIPVAFNNNRYIVEGFPAFVSDEIKLNEYTLTAFSGREVSREKRDDVFEFVSNFFTAYYSERQSVIDNYLAPDAERHRFIGLGGQLEFIKLEGTSNVYYPNQNDRTPLIASIVLTVRDKVGNTITQNFMVTLIERDGRYYVRQLDVRINNVNLEVN